MNKTFFDKLVLGKYTIKNRIFLSSLSRIRCQPKNGVPTDLIAKYYSQRSLAGLIFTQATPWTPRGQYFPGSPCLYNQAHVQGWKKVINNVHLNNSLIFVQLAHAGRATHPSLNGQLQPWAPSPLAIRQQKLKQLNGQNYPIPKQMTLQDIQQTKRQFQHSVLLAKMAGFDGVHLHGAFGFLIDQFIRSYTNRRTDKYGGSVKNRCRFALDLVDIAHKHFQPYQISIKLTPTSRARDMFDQNPIQTYSYLLKELNSKKVQMVQLSESYNHIVPDSLHIRPQDQIRNVSQTFRPHFKGIMVGNYDLSPQTGLKKIQESHCDAVSFGRLFISNPDLPNRIASGTPLNPNLDPTTFYGAHLVDKSKGYTDYPPYQL